MHLGGYCAVVQAQKLGLANSARRVVARLEALKQSGFLKQIAHYPVIYQVTGSATRLVGYAFGIYRAEDIRFFISLQNR